MQPVRRTSDGELCGHVAARDASWVAMTVFEGVIGRHGDRDAAVHQVLTEGLATLAERWTLRDAATGEEEVVCIQEANPHRILVARGYYSLPGVPTLVIGLDELRSGVWELHR